MKRHLCLSCSTDQCADQKHHFFKCVQRLEVHALCKCREKISQNYTSNLDEAFLKLPPSSETSDSIIIYLFLKDLVSFRCF
eukprot:UN24967